MKPIDAKQLESKIIKLSSSLVSANASIADIDEGLELINEVHAFLSATNYDKNSDCVAVIGASGSGKSTVVSLLFEKLLVHHEDEYTRVLIAENPSSEAIQYGPLSKTLLPGILRVHHGEKSMLVFDMPGTQDTRGPFAELVIHFIEKWLFANFKNLRFLIVATPPLERIQELSLTGTINRVCARGSKAVLVFTKCEPDFNPKIITNMKAVFPENRTIPAFALPKPKKSDDEGFNYSSLHAGTKADMLRELCTSNSNVETKAFAETIPESAQLLLRNLCNRNIAIARAALSQAFLSKCNEQNEIQFSFATASKVLDMLENPDPLTFMTYVEQVMLILGEAKSNTAKEYSAVYRAVDRLNLFETWYNGEIVRGKDNWLSTRCLGEVERIKRDLNSLKFGVPRYQKTFTRNKTMVLSGWDLQLEKGSQTILDIENFVDKLNATNIPTVVLIGFKSVSINAHFRVWTNLVIVSPDVSTKGIDLSATGRAPPPVPLRAKAGLNGIHGAPGRPGGNLTVICKENANGQFDKRSQGQRGGDGQSGGDAIKKVDLEREMRQFKTDLKSLIKRVSSLADWKLVSSKLQSNTSVKAHVEKLLPPDAGLVLLNTTGSAITAAGITAGACIPPLAPIIVPTMLPVGVGMVGIGSQRNTQKTLEIERVIAQSEKGGLPGNPGQGGCGGVSYIVQAGHLIKDELGPPGEEGQPGLSGKQLPTAVLKGTVTQEYGIFGYCRGDPQIVTSIDLNESTLVREFSPELPRAAVENPLIQPYAVKAYYEEAFAMLKEMFPKCNFCDVEMPSLADLA